ncbi:hypothetical protein P4H61_19255 [Paenibacillus peoriae]|uniref:hypothetical protein n=1 Tax=Paenibacillus peoriae TaxID=59893 RepID=UPI00026C57CF|nr:hypothetical protein [Paenibacillus peoriae]MEC0183631.1 hypothetical protein [Paenibacillus peoriae]
MGHKYRHVTVIFLVVFILIISGCTTNINSVPSVPKQKQTSNSENSKGPQDDIVYVDKETEFIASTLKQARHYFNGDANQKSQEDDASGVEMLAEYFDSEVREKFMEVSKYIRLSNKEQVRKLCDEIEADYVTPYSWKRDS